MTDFVDKKTIIEAAWLNGVDATVNDVLDGATTDAAARAAIDVPQETLETDAQCRVNGAWVDLLAQAVASHKSNHNLGGSDFLDHDLLLNGTGTKHIDHQSVSVLSGSGLTGGGDLTGDITLAFTHLLEQNLDAGGFRLTNVGAPGVASDAATKGYADNLVIEAGGNPWLGGVPADSLYYSTGYVGIGTDTPIAPLDVRGGMQVTGTLTGENGTFSNDVSASKVTVAESFIGPLTTVDRSQVSIDVEVIGRIRCADFDFDPLSEIDPTYEMRIDAATQTLLFDKITSQATITFNSTTGILEIVAPNGVTINGTPV